MDLFSPKALVLSGYGINYLKDNIHKTAPDLPPQNSTTDFPIGLIGGISTLPVVEAKARVPPSSPARTAVRAYQLIFLIPLSH